MNNFIWVVAEVCWYFSLTPHAYQSAALIGDFNNWNPNADIMTRVCVILQLFFLIIGYLQNAVIPK